MSEGRHVWYNVFVSVLDLVKANDFCFFLSGEGEGREGGSII